MFSFLRRSSFRTHEPPATIRTALVEDGLATEIDPNALRMLEKRGSYSGRSVNYFRVFDAARAAQQGVQLSSFTDLDAHPELVLGSGHIEHGGAIAMTRRAKPNALVVPARQLADRRDHADDDRVVFPSGTSV